MGVEGGGFHIVLEVVVFDAKEVGSHRLDIVCGMVPFDEGAAVLVVYFAGKEEGKQSIEAGFELRYHRDSCQLFIALFGEGGLHVHCDIVEESGMNKGFNEMGISPVGIEFYSESSAFYLLCEGG